jgi:beta-fructofuranosidase
VYTPRGGGTSELGDIEVAADGDDLHLFHLTLPNHDVVQHAVSRDGLAWRALPAALRTGDPGDCDGDQIWTMSVTPRPASKSGYVMLYTALSCTDRGQVQRVAMATSDDLMTWTKSPRNPVAEADPRWYETDPALTGSVSFRDPKPVRVGNGYLATVCARTHDGPLPRRGCAALLRSADLETWEALPPLFAPQRYWDLECPQLFRLGGDSGSEAGRWYLTAAIMEDRTQRYWVANGATGPFANPPGGDLLAPAGHYAARVTRWRGMDLLFAWHQPALARGWQSTAATVDWVNARNPFGKFLAPPLLLSARDDGSLALGSFPGWDGYRGGWDAAPAADRETMHGGSQDARDGLTAHAAGGMALLVAESSTGDCVVEGLLALSGARGGVALRLDDAGNGLYLELVPGSRRVQLQRWGIRGDERDGSLGPAYEFLQEGERHDPIPDDCEVTVRMMTVGPYVEISLDGEVAIAFMTGSPAAGRWGVWVEDGDCALREARCAPMRRPGEEDDSLDG